MAKNVGGWEALEKKKRTAFNSLNPPVSPAERRIKVSTTWNQVEKKKKKLVSLFGILEERMNYFSRMSAGMRLGH